MDRVLLRPLKLWTDGDTTDGDRWTKYCSDLYNYETDGDPTDGDRWTEYCSDLYNYETDGDSTVLDCPYIPEEEYHPILREEVEAAVKALKVIKSAEVDNIPAELVQSGGEAMIDILTSLQKTRE